MKTSNKKAYRIEDKCYKETIVKLTYEQYITIKWFIHVFNLDDYSIEEFTIESIHDIPDEDED